MAGRAPGVPASCSWPWQDCGGRQGPRKPDAPRNLDSDSAESGCPLRHQVEFWVQPIWDLMPPLCWTHSAVKTCWNPLEGPIPPMLVPQGPAEPAAPWRGCGGMGQRHLGWQSSWFSSMSPLPRLPLAAVGKLFNSEPHFPQLGIKNSTDLAEGCGDDATWGRNAVAEHAPCALCQLCCAVTQFIPQYWLSTL